MPDHPVPEIPVLANAVLILGGTAEGRALAAAADAAGLPVISSLAGRVSRPALPVGPVRIGGFGGAAGLAEYLTRHRIAAVVDATHPFAATMSANAAAACSSTGVPVVRLARPGWADRPDSVNWNWVDSIEAAAEAAATGDRRPFLTTGRQTLGRFGSLNHRFALVRVVEPPEGPWPAAWELIRDRGPYTLDGERRLMLAHTVDLLVTKDSGGAYTSPKLDAAARLGLDVVIVRRPPPQKGVPTVDSTDQALAWLQSGR